MLPPGSKIVGYRRVSTEEQKDRGASLDAQSAKLESFAASFQLDLIEIVDDGGESGKSLDRPGIRRALAMLADGRAVGLLVANLDRLTRHLGDMVHLIEAHFLADGGSHLLSASEPTETRTAVGRLQIYILATVSQYAREAGAERTAGVMKHKRTRAERTGNLAFGQAVDPSDPRRSKHDRPIALIECAADVEVEGYILGFRSAGFTFEAIAIELNARGIPAKRGVTRRSTGLWAKSSVHAIYRRAVARIAATTLDTPELADDASP